MATTDNSTPVRAVLLDDDLFVREAWRIFAEDQGLTILICESPLELMTQVKHLPRETPIFVDVELGHAKGYEVTTALHRDGFTDLYLATGYSPEEIGIRPGVKAVVGKTPPDWLRR